MAFPALDFWGCNSYVGNGFGLSFAREYAASVLAPNRAVLIVPAARMATSILAWTYQPSDEITWPNNEAQLYPDMKQRIDAALGSSGFNRIVAFHWQQGDTDMNIATQMSSAAEYALMHGADDYQTRLSTLFAWIHRDYPQYDFPMLLGESSRNNTAWSSVLHDFFQAMRAVVADDGCRAIVSSVGLTTLSDNVDFSPSSVLTLANERYAAYQALPPSCHFTPSAAWVNEPTILSISPNTQLGLKTFAVANDGGAGSYLSQTVCVDALDRPLPLDPYTCTNASTTTRKLRLAEDLPYSRVAKQQTSSDGGPPVGSEVNSENSYPVVAGDALHYVNTRMGEGQIPAPTGRVFRDFDQRDGYDIIGDVGGYVSVVGTRDPSTPDVGLLWYGMSNALGGGWVSFADEPLMIGHGEFPIQGETINTLGDSNGCRYCPWSAGSNNSQWGQDLADWSLMPFTFTSGVMLDTIRSVHTGGDSMGAQEGAGGIEILYYTQLYGTVRWETWSPTSSYKEGSEDGTDRCNGGVTQTFGTTSFHRGTCDDWTYIHLHDTPLDAFHAPLATKFSTSPNLILAADFAPPASNNYPCTYPDSGTGVEGGCTAPTPPGWQTHWQFFEDGALVSVPTDLTGMVVTDPVTENNYLGLTRTSTTHQTSIVQDVETGPLPTGNCVIEAGVLVSGPPGALGSLQVSVLAADGSPVPGSQSQISFQLNAVTSTGGWSTLRLNSVRDLSAAPTAQLRFELGLQTGGSYKMDEAFLAVLPADGPGND